MMMKGTLHLQSLPHHQNHVHHHHCCQLHPPLNHLSNCDIKTEERKQDIARKRDIKETDTKTPIARNLKSRLLNCQLF